VKPRLIEIDNERFEALKEGLDEMVADELFKQEAAARKISPEQLERRRSRRRPASRRRRDPAGLRREQGAAPGPDARRGEAAHRRVPEGAEGRRAKEAFITSSRPSTRRS
jgi:hypothetical protein